VPYLQADSDNRRAPAFFLFLKPFLSTVRDHAQRELRILELEGVIPTGEVTADDLTDDVLVAAWESFNERPQEAPIDVWLMGILHERLSELEASYGDVKLSTPIEDESIEQADADVDDLHYWLSRALEPPATLTLEDVIPDERSADGWQEMDVKEQHEHLLRMLQRLQKHQRQAFMLSEVEGFELSEIAMVLDRQEDDVADDIERARSLLQSLSEAPAEKQPTGNPDSYRNGTA
jgi:RNA polymerase sigma factor (sigma-70 family)